MSKRVIPMDRATLRELEPLGFVFKRKREHVCKFCGCTDERACPGGCYWVNAEKDLCSRCALNMDLGAGLMASSTQTEGGELHLSEWNQARAEVVE